MYTKGQEIPKTKFKQVPIKRQNLINCIYKQAGESVAHSFDENGIIQAKAKAFSEADNAWPRLYLSINMEYLYHVSLKGGYKTFVFFSITEKKHFGQGGFTVIRMDSKKLFHSRKKKNSQNFSNHSCCIIYFYSNRSY